MCDLDTQLPAATREWLPDAGISHHAKRPEPLERQSASLIIENAKNTHCVEHCSAFHSGPTRDREMLCAIRFGSESGAFSDVELLTVRWIPGADHSAVGLSNNSAGRAVRA